MALSFSEPTRLEILQAFLGGSDWTPPTSYDVGLFTSDPNNGGVECTGTGYARVTVDNDNTTWAVVAGTFNTIFRNAADIVFTASAGAGWGQPNWLCFFEAGTSNKIFAVQISNAAIISTGDPFKVNTGDLTVQLLN